MDEDQQEGQKVWMQDPRQGEVDLTLLAGEVSSFSHIFLASSVALIQMLINLN